MDKKALETALDEMDYSFQIMRNSTDQGDRMDAIENYISSARVVRAAVFGDGKEEA